MIVLRNLGCQFFRPGESAVQDDQTGTSFSKDKRDSLRGTTGTKYEDILAFEVNTFRPQRLHKAGGIGIVTGEHAALIDNGVHRPHFLRQRVKFIQKWYHCHLVRYGHVQTDDI